MRLQGPFRTENWNYTRDGLALKQRWADRAEQLQAAGLSWWEAESQAFRELTEA